MVRDRVPEVLVGIADIILLTSVADRVLVRAPEPVVDQDAIVVPPYFNVMAWENDELFLLSV